ncbi:glycosyltransferase [Chromatocurvus halotolerans]|uniref:1,2-diacylglycerol 3-glucosyltransferase n=1 Tax=Chromatocurvus halotolerans TaxID=1132028 RepID=A0A4R2KXU6_9GAMM|nr:glycosyltransferase [Chromatocurvus halotolerans]TCO77902.1 1,2-diacylglycerol 3-glucosyltransferase [Chromatocurvus halotolerans]
MRSKALRWLYWLSLALASTLVIYKIYLNFFEVDFAAEHAVQVENLEAVLEGRQAFSFAVVGNISNSVGIFERKIIPRLNQSGYDFVVSAGNAVSSGGEDKYRAVYRTLARLDMPYVLTFGPQEESRLGGFRFYDHFGPLHFSFAAGNSRFVFIDSTGTTDFGWQQRWLEEELAAADETNVFLFSAHPLYPVERSGLFDPPTEYLFEEAERKPFRDMIEGSGVRAVFSATLPQYDQQHHGGTAYIVTGGAGGLVINNERSHYHFVSIHVEGDQFFIREQRLQFGQHPLWLTLESFWFFIHSLFYVGYLNFILLVSLLIALALWLHSRIFTDTDYYPDFDVDPDEFKDATLRVAMFTNNYLPFVGGVPISIQRLHRGLVQLGHSVLIIAPRYPGADTENSKVLRVRALLPLGRHREFRLANVFSVSMYWQIYRFRPDIIHVHHPFWLGSAGLFIGRRLGIPVVYTYHTRLEHYAHYVPLPGPLFRNLVSHAVVRRFANRCDGVIVPTESAEEYLRTIGVRRRVLVQPTGIDIDRLRSVQKDAVEELRNKYAPNGERILVSISRLSKEKNIDFLLDAIRKLKNDSNHAFRLLVIGDGPERNRIESRIRQQGLQDAVILLGTIAPDEMPLYCRAGEVFLFASRSETQGMVIIEAMAAGMPVVAVRSSGIDDIVEDGVNGFKTPLDIARWCARIEQILEDPRLYKRLSATAVTTAETYSIARFSDSVRRFYATIIATRQFTGRHADERPANKNTRYRAKE